MKLVLLLLFLNFISTAYLIWIRSDNHQDRQQKRRKEQSVEFLRDQLKLTNDQVQFLQGMREKYAREEAKIATLTRAQRDSMNRMMFSAESDTARLRLLAGRVAANAYRMEMLRVQQAEEFKKCCTPGQLDSFRNLMVQIRDFFQPERKKD